MFKKPNGTDLPVGVEDEQWPRHADPISANRLCQFEAFMRGIRDCSERNQIGPFSSNYEKHQIGCSIPKLGCHVLQIDIIQLKLQIDIIQLELQMDIIH